MATNYTGDGGKLVTVNTGETALEFTDAYYTKTATDTLLNEKESFEAYTTVNDMPDSTTVYVGKALIGSATSGALWRVKKVIITGSSRASTWADGNSNYDNIWDNRISLSYR